MGFMDKIKGMVNPDADYGVDEDFENGYGYDDMDQDFEPAYTAPAQPQTPAAQTFGGMGNSALELKVVRPERFDSVTQIADHLLNKRTVVLNLENASKETARRLIDFLSGVAYSIDGSIKKIATNAYVITPNNVDVGDAQLRAPKAKDPEPEVAPEPNADVFPEF